MAYYTVAQLAAKMGVPHQRVLERVYRKRWKAKKLGSIWVISKRSVEAVDGIR